MATQQPPTSSNGAVGGAPGSVAGGGEGIGSSVTGTSPGPGAAAAAAAAATAAGYKRASRKGAPRRFACDNPGCDKIYSRAEHLQRHQLNHNPKEIYRCDVQGCDQKFVRADLLARHKKRHSSSYIPRNRVPSFSTTGVAPPGAAGPGGGGPTTVSPSAGVQSRPSFPQTSARGAYDPTSNSMLLTPESNAAPTPTTMANAGQSQNRLGQQSSWPPPMDEMAAVNIIRQKPGYYPREPPPMPPEATTIIPYSAGVPVEADESMIARDNFAAWLFDPQTTFSEFSVANIPFMEGGLESTFNNNIHYDYESLTSRSQLDPTPPRQMEGPDDLISEVRRAEVLRTFQHFRQQSPKYEPNIVNLVSESASGDMPGLNLEMLRDCLHEYWESIGPRLPIIHQPTFSSNRCPILLLMVMIALGAASLRSRDAGGTLTEYGGFADVIIESVRWEIVMHEEASPPVGLWVAQALLLLEYYEKLYSSRRFHERAHIYHSATLTLLRRGSPLIGRAGSESPPEEAAPGEEGQPSHAVPLDSRAWWIRWAETESMHRVVFAAFMLDIIHAAMFGHTADMASHEIRLPLPCDDNLWMAPSPDTCRRLDADLKMYGIPQVSFLDGLKNALHGKEVRTHSFARMIIMSGLLSVGWHLSHRETHLKWLDLRTPSMEAQDSWRKMLLRAFDSWKVSFDSANVDSAVSDSHQRGGSKGPIHTAAVLYHLAHICLHVDIIDCQVYAGAKRLLGRKVSARDHTNSVGRMKTWAHQASTRHAVLHAFKLLHRVLVSNRTSKKRSTTGFVSDPVYSLRNDPDPHRPWIMYYAVLSIWSFVRAVQHRPHQQQSSIMHGAPVVESYRRMTTYLSSVANLDELNEKTALGLFEGLPDLLDALAAILSEANSELLHEAHKRLKVCKDMLLASPSPSAASSAR